MDESSGGDLGSRRGGRQRRRVRVAPDVPDSGRINTLRNAPPVPFCVQIPDALFAFDRSYVRFRVLAGLASRLSKLEDALKKTASGRLSVFGHTDATERVPYHNKALALRRSQAIYAVLVRDVKLLGKLSEHEKWTFDDYKDMVQGAPRPAMIIMTDNERRLIRDLDKRQQLASARLTRVSTYPTPPAARTEREGLLDRLLLEALQRTARLEKHQFQKAGEDFLYLLGCSHLNRVVPARGRNERNRRVVIYMWRRGIPTELQACRRGTADAFSDPRSGSGRRALAAAHRHCLALCDRRRDTYKCTVYNRLFLRTECEEMDRWERCKLIKTMYDHLKAKGLRKSVYECTLLRILERCWDFQRCKPRRRIDCTLLNPWIYNFLYTSKRNRSPYKEYVADIVRSGAVDRTAWLHLRRQQGGRWVVVKVRSIRTEKGVHASIRDGAISTHDFFDLPQNQVPFFEAENAFMNAVLDDAANFHSGGGLDTERAIRALAGPISGSEPWMSDYRTGLPIITWLERMFMSLLKMAQQHVGGESSLVVPYQFKNYYDRETVKSGHQRSIYGCFRRGGSSAPSIYDGPNRCARERRCDPRWCLDPAGRKIRTSWRWD